MLRAYFLIFLFSISSFLFAEDEANFVNIPANVLFQRFFVGQAPSWQDRNDYFYLDRNGTAYLVRTGVRENPSSPYGVVNEIGFLKQKKAGSFVQLAENEALPGVGNILFAAGLNSGVCIYLAAMSGVSAISLYDRRGVHLNVVAPSKNGFLFIPLEISVAYQSGTDSLVMTGAFLSETETTERRYRVIGPMTSERFHKNFIEAVKRNLGPIEQSGCFGVLEQIPGLFNLFSNYNGFSYKNNLSNKKKLDQCKTKRWWVASESESDFEL